MKVKMIADVSGSCDGVPWPKKGEVVDLPENQAKSAIASDLAVEVDADTPTNGAAPWSQAAYEGDVEPDIAGPYDHWEDDEKEEAPMQSPSDFPEAPEDGVRVGATSGQEQATAPDAETPEAGLTTRTGPTRAHKTAAKKTAAK